MPEKDIRAINLDSEQKNSQVNSKPSLENENPQFALSLWRLLIPEVIANPNPLYHRIRTQEPVRWDSFLRAWIVTSYDEVVKVIRVLSAKRTPSREGLRETGMEHLSPITSMMEKMMLLSDPPYHTRVRTLISSTFTADKVATMAERIRQIARSLLARAARAGELDVVADYADPLPGMVMAALFGVPEQDYFRLSVWAADLAETFGNFTQHPARTPEVLRSCEEMSAYFREATSRCPHIREQSLLHALTTTAVDGDALTEDEVVANVAGMLVGGQESSTSLIGTALVSLFDNPEQLELLRRDQSAFPSAIEELFRFNSPVQVTGRLAIDSFELGGKEIFAGQPVLAVLGAANCDPTRFPDPDRLDLTRADNRHVAFGWGPHFCVGAALARLEMRIALECLLDLPNLHIKREGMRWRSHLVFRGLEVLPVGFSRRAAVFA
jgi:cytochrome P450